MLNKLLKLLQEWDERLRYEGYTYKELCAAAGGSDGGDDSSDDSSDDGWDDGYDDDFKEVDAQFDALDKEYESSTSSYGGNQTITTFTNGSYQITDANGNLVESYDALTGTTSWNDVDSNGITTSAGSLTTGSGYDYEYDYDPDTGKTSMTMTSASGTEYTFNANSGLWEKELTIFGVSLGKVDVHFKDPDTLQEMSMAGEMVADLLDQMGVPVSTEVAGAIDASVEFAAAAAGALISGGSLTALSAVGLALKGANAVAHIGMAAGVEGFTQEVVDDIATLSAAANLISGVTSAVSFAGALSQAHSYGLITGTEQAIGTVVALAGAGYAINNFNTQTGAFNSGSFTSDASELTSELSGMPLGNVATYYGSTASFSSDFSAEGGTGGDDPSSSFSSSRPSYANGIGNSTNPSGALNESQLYGELEKLVAWNKLRNVRRENGTMVSEDVNEFFAGGAKYELLIAGGELFTPLAPFVPDSCVTFSLPISKKAKQSLLQEDSIYENLQPIKSSEESRDTSVQEISNFGKKARINSIIDQINMLIEEYNLTIDNYNNQVPTTITDEEKLLTVEEVQAKLDDINNQLSVLYNDLSTI